MPGVRPQYQQPKKIEFKKEPDFNAGLKKVVVQDPISNEFFQNIQILTR